MLSVDRNCRTLGATLASSLDAAENGALQVIASEIASPIWLGLSDTDVSCSKNDINVLSVELVISGSLGSTLWLLLAFCLAVFGGEGANN